MLLDLHQITIKIDEMPQQEEALLVVVIGEQPFALPLNALQQVAEVDNAITVPFAPAGIIGAMALHGSVISLVDIFNENTWRPYVLVLSPPATNVGILADRVEGIYGFKLPEYTPEEQELAKSIRETVGLLERGVEGPTISPETRIIKVENFAAAIFSGPATTQDSYLAHRQ